MHPNPHTFLEGLRTSFVSIVAYCANKFYLFISCVLTSVYLLTVGVEVTAAPDHTQWHKHTRTHTHSRNMDRECVYGCVCVCVYVCMYVCKYVCVCMYVYVCMYVCMYVCVCVCMCMYVCVYVCMYVCVCMYVFFGLFIEHAPHRTFMLPREVRNNKTQEARGSQTHSADRAAAGIGGHNCKKPNRLTNSCC
jgi:hypothetical protein